MFRWLSLAELVCVVGISSVFRWRARRASGTIARIAEGPALILMRLVVALPLFLSILAYFVRPAWMTWAAFALPEPWRWLGAAFGLLAVPLAWWVFSSIGSNVSETILTKKNHQLITHGPYRWIRHPLYATGLLLLSGIGLMAANWFMLALTLLALAGVLTIIIPREERALIERFGEGYRQYMRGTGRLVPGVGRARSEP